MTTEKTLKDKLLFWLAILLIFISIFGYGYINHINHQKVKAENLASKTTKVDVIKACSSFLSFGGDILPYKEYKKGIFECSASHTQNAEDKSYVYSYTGTGLEKYVIDQKIGLVISGAVQSSVGDSDRDKKAINSLAEWADIVSETYGVNTPKNIFIKDQKPTEGIYETNKYLLEVRNFEVKKGVEYFEIHFVGR